MGWLGRRTTLRMARIRGVLAIVAASAVGVLMTACGSGTGTTTPTNYTLTVDSTNPASGVSIEVGNPLNNVVSQASTPFTETAASGTQYILGAPATAANGNTFSSWTGCTSTSGTGNVDCNVTLNSNMTVTANYSTPTKATPTVTVTPSSYSIVSGAAFSVTVTVTAPSGDPTPTGSVVLSTTGFTSTAQTLTNGSVTVSVPMGAWTAAPGTYTITATYTPDTNSSSTYNTNTGTSGNITVTAAPVTYTLTVDSSGVTSGIAITDSPADNNGLTSGSTPFTLSYNSGTTVNLTAPLTPGWVFTSWTGCASTSGTSGSVCTVTMNANTTVTANYTMPATSVLTVDSTNPGSGVTIQALAQGSTTNTGGATPFTITAATGTMYALTAPSTAGGNNFSSWTGCASTSGTGNTTCNVTLSANITVTANYAASTSLVTPTVTVSPSSGSVNTEQPLPVTVTVSAPSGSGDPTPTGSVVLSNGNGYTSSATTLSGGSTVITVPAGQLPQGLNTLTATYTPDTNSSGTYNSATGSHTVTVTLITPTVTVTPQSNTIDDQQSLQVQVTVAGTGSDPTPTGSVVVSYGTTYSSASTALTSGSATITIPAGTLPNGSDTLTATYTPDSGSSGIYETATGTSGAVTVGAATSVTVDQSSVGPATTDKILGVNLEAWYDNVGHATTINAALGAPGSNNTGGAGMASIRWPGGSWSDAYHWNNTSNYNGNNLPYMCNCTVSGNSGNTTTCTAASSGTGWGGYSTFAEFANAIPKAGGFDLALTANYGTNETCTGGGDPNEAASWAAAAVADGITPSHITVGNEVYGVGWEVDLHTKQHDPTTYANAVTGADGNGGYYPLIKAQSANTLVGVVVDADGSSTGWDHTVLSGAKGDYDFVEYHYYPQYTDVNSDSALIYNDGPLFTTNINTVKNELTAAGETPCASPTGAGCIPIYAGELGGNSGPEGTQGWSITQGLFAGQILGEAMNDGVSRLTWWDGFGNCQGAGNNSSNLYGWQNTWGAENIFSDADPNCPGEGAIGTLSPTARAFQLFSYVAVPGENVLTATVSGADTTDVKAYAATHSGGTALVLFNLNKTTPESVNITLTNPSQTSATSMQVITYDKEIYDYTNVNCEADQTGQPNGNNCTYDPTHNYSTAVWAPPVTTTVSSPQLPYTLVLQPWSINVVIINN